MAIETHCDVVSKWLLGGYLRGSLPAAETDALSISVKTISSFSFVTNLEGKALCLILPQ